MDFVVPCERLASVGGYQPGAPDATHEVQIYLANNPNPAGNELRIHFDGLNGTWTGQPFINASTAGPDPLLWLGFRYIGTDSSFGPNPQMGAGSITNTGFASTVNCALYVWQDGRYLVEYESLADKRQPVDWVVKTLEARDNGNQIKVRGVFVEAMHLGNGLEDALPGWRYGPLNTATSTDMRDYSGQSLDFATVPPGNSEQTNILQRSRMRPVATQTPGLKVGTPAVPAPPDTAPRWSTTADLTLGNLLIDDAAVDTMATTDGSQGERASVMLHGTMNAPGESVRVGKVEAALRMTGARRRWH